MVIVSGCVCFVLLLCLWVVGAFFVILLHGSAMWGSRLQGFEWFCVCFWPISLLIYIICESVSFLIGKVFKNGK